MSLKIRQPHFYLRFRDFLLNLSLTNWLILINIFFFVVALFFGAFSSPVCEETICKYLALNPFNILQGKYLWTLITSMFMHGSFAHLFVNMVSLMFIGNFVEKIIGRKRFFWFYLISGVVASLFFVMLSFLFGINTEVFAVGASGAIFALGGLLMILTPRLTVLVFFVIPLPMYLAMLFLLVSLWLISFLAGLPIGNTAHLGGLLAGVVYGLYLKRKYRKKVMLLNRYFS